MPISGHSCVISSTLICGMDVNIEEIKRKLLKNLSPAPTVLLRRHSCTQMRVADNLCSNWVLAVQTIAWLSRTCLQRCGVASKMEKRKEILQHILSQPPPRLSGHYMAL